MSSRGYPEKRAVTIRLRLLWEGRAGDHDDGTDPAASQCHRRRMGSRLRRRRYVIHNPARPRECLGEFADSTPRTSRRDRRRREAAAARVGRHSGAAARSRALPVRPAARRIEGRARAHHHARAGQGARRVGRRSRTRGGRSALHGRRGQPRRWARRFPASGPATSCHTVAEPLGVVAAICPWNFPVVTPVRKIAPALAWGNTVVFKPVVADAVVRRLSDAAARDAPALPPGVVNLVTGPGARRRRRADSGRTRATASPLRDRRAWARTISETCGATARASATRAWRQESGGRRRLRRSRRRRAGDRRGGLSVQRPAVHGDQPRDRRRARRPTRWSSGSWLMSTASRSAMVWSPAPRWGRWSATASCAPSIDTSARAWSPAAALLTGGRALTGDP